MKFLQTFIAINALLFAAVEASPVVELSAQGELAVAEANKAFKEPSFHWADIPRLYKRARVGGSRIGSSGSRSGSSSSGSTTGSSGSTGSSSGSTTGNRGSPPPYSAGASPPPYSSISNAGGRTIRGSGTPKSSSGYYSGGSAVPYRAGARSPIGIYPFFLPPFFLFGAYGAYSYGYYGYRLNRTETYHNETTNANQTLPVVCVCQEYETCGCDANDAGNYTLPADVSSAVINGTQYAVVNGSLANGTTSDGGTDASSESDESTSGSSSSSEASAAMPVRAETLGWAVVGATLMGLASQVM
ncbi:hypothetical protein YB2330_001620 [Saitoella coloradoensis]